MDCRACGVCCTAISISSNIPGMGAKPAGVRCIYLGSDNLCKLFGKAERPAICGGFQATVDICGESSEEALVLIGKMEVLTAP